MPIYDGWTPPNTRTCKNCGKEFPWEARLTCPECRFADHKRIMAEREEIKRDMERWADEDWRDLKATQESVRPTL